MKQNITNSVCISIVYFLPEATLIDEIYNTQNMVLYATSELVNLSGQLQFSPNNYIIARTFVQTLYISYHEPSYTS